MCFEIVSKHDSHRNVIQNNEFYDTIFSWAWDAVKAESNVGVLETGGVRFWDSNPGEENKFGRGNIIRRNIFHDFFDGFGACAHQTRANPTNETDVYENLIYNAGDDGMEADGPCSNVRIWKNIFHDVLVGISVAPARIGPVYAIRNLIYRTGATLKGPFGQKGPGGGTAFKFQNENPGTGPVYLFHNTTEAGTGSHGVYISEPLKIAMLVSRNNIWVSSSAWAIDNTSDDPADFDYDDLVSARGWNLLRWKDQRFLRLRDFSVATGQERHGLNVDPGFVNPSKGDYELLPNSPLIDVGVLIPGINDDFNGRAPDIGAFEFQGK